MPAKKNTKSTSDEIQDLKNEVASLKEMLQNMISLNGKMLEILEETNKQPIKSSAKIDNKDPTITVTKYSEKSFLIKGFGTLKIKDSLKEIKASWNKSLGGWILSVKNEDSMKEVLSKAEKVIYDYEQEAADDDSDPEDSDNEEPKVDDDDSDSDSDDDDSDNEKPKADEDSDDEEPKVEDSDDDDSDDEAKVDGDSDNDSDHASDDDSDDDSDPEDSDGDSDDE